MHASKVKAMLPRLHLRGLEHGNALVRLYPSHCKDWWPIIEDVFASPPVRALQAHLLQEMIIHEEFESISVDATLRICLTLQGQASYRAAAIVRAQAAFDDDASLRRLLTVKGRTGGVLLMKAIREESAEHGSTCVTRHLASQAREQVKYIFSDEPSHHLWALFQPAFPALQVLCLDPLHLAIVYEYATWRKRTAGSKLLRIIVGKFSKVDRSASAATWGEQYTGVGERPLAAEERRVRDRITSGAMPKKRASHVLEWLNPETPYYTRVEFIEALAALSALHPEDMSRRVTGSNKELCKLLWSAAAPGRIEWFLNNQRARHAMQYDRIGLLPIGTTSNESLHAELNANFRQIQCLHQSTLELKLNILTIHKQMSHNAALYHPTTRQVPSNVVVSIAICKPMWTDDAWTTWCDELQY